MAGAWIASQYLDDGRWGIVDEDNAIIVGVSTRMTQKRAEEIAGLRASQLRLARALTQTRDGVTFSAVVEEAARIVREEG